MKKYINIFYKKPTISYIAKIQNLPWSNPLLLTKQVVNHFRRDSLYRNSIYLLLSNFSMAVFGFFFWLVVARLYNPSQIGIATSLIAVMSLVSTFSQIGFNNTIIRYLPASKRKNNIINTAFTLVGVAALVVGTFYLVGISIFSPKLAIVRENTLYAVLFLAAIMINAVNSLSDNVFISYRDTKYILINNMLLSMSKLSLPFILIGFGSFGIFLSVVGGLTTALVLTFLFLIFKYHYVPRLQIDRKTLRHTARYSAGTYFTGLIGSLPSMITPILVLNILSTTYAAYYYMAFTIANLLFIIPQAVTRSMFAESTNDINTLCRQLKKSAVIITFLSVPAITSAFFAGYYILHAFGASYSQEGFILLKYFSISLIFVSISYLGGMLFYIRGDIRNMLIFNTTNAIITIGFVYIGLNLTNDFVGLGIAFLASQTIMALLYMPYLVKAFRRVSAS